MPALRVRIRLRGLRKPHQGTGVRAQRKQIGPELVMQLARNLLALQVLERDRALSEPPLVLHGFPQSGREVIQPGADRREFRRAAGRDTRIVGPFFDTRHGLR